MEMTRLPSVVSWPHALTEDGRDFSFARFLPSETLGRYIERVGLKVAKGPVYVLHNGVEVPQALWTRLIPRDGDQIIIRARVQGGGGGSKVLRTIALIAVAVVSIFAPYLAPAAWGATGAAALGAAIAIGGSILVNALIPLPKPNLSGTGVSSVENAPSYQIQAARNTSRPFEPMLLVMGGPIKVVPDIGSNPSTQYVGDDQYLSQVFHFGLQPDMVITGLKIGDSPIENFQGVQIERSGWDGAITLAPDNVDTLQGFDLNQYDDWNYRTTPDSTTYFEVETATILFSLDAATGKFLQREVVFQVEYRNVTSSVWFPIGAYTDAIYATHYWSYGYYQGDSGDGGGDHANWVQLNYGSLNPSDHVNGEQHQECQTWGGGDAGDNYSCTTYQWIWQPHPFQLGQPWQGIAPDPLITYVTSEGNRLTNDSSKPLRYTLGQAVPLGQYEIRIRKITPDISTNTDSNVISVTQIRAYQYTPTDYSNQARLAVRIRATSQLNGPIDELSAICTPACNMWNGSAWVYSANANPAWWFLWFALGKRDAAGNKLYGACIPEAQIDVESIKAWGTWCAAKGWTFRYILAQKMSAHDLLTMIARAGQASYTWQSGKLGVVWDQADLPVVAMIGPFNIKAGTFEVSYVDATVDEIVGNFVNKDRDWQADQVRVRVPGAPILNNPQTFDLEGIDDAAVAGRVVNLLAASQNFHRRRVSWEMDIEGYIATRGDVVQASHDLTVWGYSGRLTGGTRSQIFLDRKVPISEAAGAYLCLRAPDGRMIYTTTSWFDGDTDVLNLYGGIPDDFPMPSDMPDIVPMDWAWQMDPIQTPGRRLKIVSVTPTNDDGVRFEAVDDNPDYYKSETNPFAYTPPRDGALLRGVILALSYEESIQSVSSDAIQIRLDWVISSAGRARVDYRVNGNAAPSVTTTDRYFIFQAHTGDVVTATITPVGDTGSGVAKSGTWTVAGLAAPLPTVTGLTNVFRDGLTWLAWSRVDDARVPSYEIRLGPTWTNARTIAVTDGVEALAVGNGLYWVAAKFILSNGTIIYGAPDSILIAGATLVRNVLVTQDEAPDWTGTLSDGAYIYDGKLTLAPQGDILSLSDVLAEQDVLWYGGPAASGVYTNAEADQIDIGFVAPVRVDFDLELEARNVTADILIVPDIFAVADVLNGSDLLKVVVTPQIRTAVVDGEWSDWRDYVPGLINARYFDVRLLMATVDPLIIPFVSKFQWTIDVPDLLQRAEGVTIPVGGMRITYAKAFHAIPNVQISILDAVSGDRFVLTNSDEEGFNVSIMNGSTSVERRINWITQGF